MTGPEDEQSAADTVDGAASTPVAPPARASRGRWLKVVVVVTCTLAAVYGVVWWQDRPIREIQAKVERKQPALALAQADAYLAAHPDDARVKALKARALVDAGKSREAIALFEEVGVASPSEIYAMARAFMSVAQWTRATNCLKQVQALDARNADVLQDLIGCQFQTGAHADGLDNANALAKLPGHEARGLAWRAFFLNSVDDRKVALDAFAATLKASPEGTDLPVPAADFFLRYAEALTEDKQLDAARKMVERSLKSSPSAAAFVQLAKIHEQAGDSAEAIKAYTRAIDLDPAQPDACEALAAQALAEGDVDTAQRRLKPLGAQMTPRRKMAEILAGIYEKNGDPAEARRWRARVKQMEARQHVDDAIKRLLRKSPESFWACVVRAHDFAVAGNWSQAREMLIPWEAQATKEAFVVDLWTAIEQHGPLPSLERLPLDQF